MHSVIANKSTDSIRTMLPSTARNITWSHRHKAYHFACWRGCRHKDASHTFGRPRSPLLRGRRKFVVPSKRGYRSEMGMTYVNLRNQGQARARGGLSQNSEENRRKGPRFKCPRTALRVPGCAAVQPGRQPELDAAVRSGADWTRLMTPAAQGGYRWRRSSTTRLKHAIRPSVKRL